MSMTPEEFTQELKGALGDELVSALLYGSGAHGDRRARFSDFNVLVVVAEMSTALLDQVSGVVGRWLKAGNPPPLLFTRARLLQAEDVFPVEFLELQSSRRVLAGEDVFAGVVVGNANLRHQLEYELRGKLLALRQRYLQARGKSAALIPAVAGALPALFALFRGVLRLAGETPPVEKSAILEAMGRHAGVDRSAFSSALEARAGKTPAMAGRAIFEGVTASLERIIDFVDGFPAG